MLVASAVKIEMKSTGKKVVLCGVRHGDCFKQMQDLGLPRGSYKELEQGFVTNHNQFMNRVDALVYAIQIGQASADVADQFGKNKKQILFSEDLW